MPRLYEKGRIVSDYLLRGLKCVGVSGPSTALLRFSSLLKTLASPLSSSNSFSVDEHPERDPQVFRYSIVAKVRIFVVVTIVKA